jgi:signal transduction histidine kinase/PAS domain-containing protein/BarA-like signal transduction histidine kinase
MRRLANARQALLDECRNLLLDPECPPLSIAELTRSCGMATGTFYHYFKDKSEIALCVVDERWDEALSSIDAIASSGAPLAERLDLVAAALRSFRGDIALFSRRFPVGGDEGLYRKAASFDALRARVGLMIGAASAAGQLDGLVVSDETLRSIVMDRLVAGSSTSVSGFPELLESLGAPSARPSSSVAGGTGASPIARLNAELRREVAEYDMLMESTGVCIVKLSLARGYPFEWCNEATFRTFGYSREEYEAAFGYDLASYFVGREALLEPLRGAIESALSQGEPRFSTLLSLPTKDGAVWVQGGGTFTDPDPATARPARVYCVFADVTPTMEMQRRLAAADQENARLVGLLDNIPAGVCACFVEGGEPTRAFVNNYLSSMLGIESGQVGIEGRDALLDHVHPGEREEASVALERLFRRGDDVSCVFRIEREGTGRFAWTSLEGRLVRAPDGSSVAYISFADVSEMKSAEERLRESRRAYRNAVRAVGLIMWDYDIPNRRIVMSDDEVTQAERAEFGWDRTIEDVPASLVGLIADDDVEPFLSMFRQVQAGHDATCDVWYRDRAGQEPRCERITYTVVADGEGVPAHAYGIGQNITAEKKVEERYEHEMDVLRQSTTEDMISKGHCNLTRNAIIGYELLGESPYSAFEGQPYDEALAGFLQGIDISHTDRPLAELLSRDSLIRRYQRGEMHLEVTYRRVVPGAVPIWVSTVMHTYMMPATGDLELFSYSYDVTEKALEGQIIASLADLGYDELGFIYPQTESYAVYRVGDGSGRVTKGSGGFGSGLERNLASGTIPADEVERIGAALRLDRIVDELSRERVYSLSSALVGADGRDRQMLFQFFYLAGREDTIFFCTSDTTEQHAAELAQIETLRAARLEADRANGEKSSFLSSMSHDIRTPLNGVLGFIGIALREQDPDRKQECIEKAKVSAELLLGLVNDVLDLSRIESGRMTLDPEVVDVSELAPAVVESLRPIADAKDVRLVSGPYPDGAVFVDKLKDQKIWLNLVSNAIKYTPSGGTVWARVEVIDPPVDGHNRRVVIEDTGIGMSEEFQRSMFEPFAQERRPEAAGVQGTGLGLAIVKRIVDLLGGSIRVRSAPGQGTRFEIDLGIPPVDRARELAAASSRKVADLAGRRVLLCEDNAMNAEIATTLLRERGIEVDCEPNGAMGVEAFAGSEPGHYDAVLMDVRMPVMDGREATREIRALDRPDARAVPVIAMSADAFEEDLRLSMEAGMTGYVSKPVSPDQLYDALAKGMTAR